MLLTGLDMELFIEVFDELKRAKTKKVTSFHSPSSYNPKTFSEDVEPHNISLSGSFISDVVSQGRKLDYLTQIEDDVLFIYFNRDIATYLLLSKGGVAGYPAAISDDLFSVGAKTKGQILGQVREAIDDRCTTDGSEVTDTDAMRNKAIQLIPLDLTVSRFQMNAATGTMTSPEKINDNSTGHPAYSDTIDQYVEVKFSEPFRLNKYRHFGHAFNSDDGVFKIQYFNHTTEAWVNWITGISTREDNWSGWIGGAIVITTKIRLITTTLDSGPADSIYGELEMKYEV